MKLKRWRDAARKYTDLILHKYVCSFFCVCVFFCSVLFVVYEVYCFNIVFVV